MTKDEVISKVRKLFELSRSENENEAALAATKARELLSRHNLEMADLPADEVKGAVEITEAFVETGRVLRNWVKGLILHVCRGFECQHVLRRRPGANPQLSFIGTRTDAQVAAYTFGFLVRELMRLSDMALPDLKRQHRGWKTASIRQSYLTGAVMRIGERFEEHADRIRAKEQVVCKDLILAKEQMIDRYMEQKIGPVRREYGRAVALSARAFEQGYVDAAELSLRPGIEEDTREKNALTA